MNLLSAWPREFIAVAVLMLGVGWLGARAGHSCEALLAVCGSYLAWHLTQIFRMSLWISNPKNYPPPSALGVWRVIILRVRDLRSRDRKRKRKLSRMLSGFQESTSALPDATVVLDSKERIEWWNGVSGRMLGLSRKRDKWQRIDARIRDPVFRSYLSEANFSHPLQMPSPVDEGVSLEVRIVPYGKGKHLLQARDITRLQQLETVRRDFVANVSHEIRTPLTVVHGYLESMADSEDESLQPWQYIIGQMQQQSSRIQGVVEDLLLLSRLESHGSSPAQSEVNVPQLIRRLLEEGKTLSGDQEHRFTSDVADDLWLMGEQTEIYSAFSNLLFNAVRYTPARGEIRLSWESGEQGPCFSVTDTGIGIEPEHIPRLTERFYRVDVGRSRQSGGTGLGLAIVKHVLTRHSGRLSIESESGKGSIFSCNFPESRAVRVAVSDPSSPQSVSNAQVGKGIVLG